MIGPIWRKILRIVAYLVIAQGVLAAANILIQQANHSAEYDSGTTLLMLVVTTLMTSTFQGGLLLVLLSIDERLERKG